VKELVEAIRDYRTVIPMVFLSIVLGPLLTLSWPNLAATQAEKIVRDTYCVALIGDSPLMDKLLRRQPELKIVDIGTDVPQKDVDKGVIDAAIVLPPAIESLLESDLKSAQKIDILYDGAKLKSTIARLRLASIVEEFNRQILKRRMAKLDIHIQKPPYIEGREAEVNSPFGVASQFLQFMLTGILMMMALMGIIYPALDAITGERERHTLEPLLMTQAGRNELFTAKLLVVSTTSYVSVILTMIGFFASQFLQRGIMPAAAMGMAVNFPWPCFLLATLCMLPLCITIAASALMLASFAKTIQQGQGYFLPLMMLGLMPLPVAMLGDIHLGPAIAAVPFLNSVVAFNDILCGYVNFAWLAVAFISSIVFCLMLVKLASPLMAREDLLFDVQESPERRFAANDYRRELFFLCTTVFLLMFYGSQVLVLNYRILGLALTQILVVLMPALLFVHYWLRLPLDSVLKFGRPRGGMASIVSAALMAPATIALASLFVFLQSKIMPGAETIGKLMAKALELGNAPLLVLILVIGVLPGLCEEVLFRGVILSLLPRRYSQTKVIVVVGTLFGAFHMSLARFLPTGLLGALLAFLRLRSGSLWPCMVLHCLHNSFSVVLATYVPGDPPLWMYVAGLASGVVGILGFLKATETAET